MRKRTMGIIGGLVLVAALGAAAAALLLTNDTTAEESSDSQTESSTPEITLTEQDTGDVTSIDVENASGSFEVVRLTEATADENATFAIAGWETLPFSTTLYTLPNNTASMSASEVVEEDASDLEKFGLDDENAVKVTLHFADNTTYAFRVGNISDDENYTYFAPSDADTVYLVSTSYLGNFKNTPASFLSTTILADPGEDERPTVEQFTLERADMDYTMVLDYDTTADDDDYTGGTVATHIMSSPVTAYLSPDRSTDVITGMFGLSADSAAVPLPTDADMQTYGLSDPYGTATMACEDGNTYVLRFSEASTETDDSGEEGTYYYVYLDGVDIIYRVDADDFTWGTVNPTDIASRIVLATYVWDVGILNVSVTGGETFAFTAEGTDADDTVVTLNGETTDSERYRAFYTFLLNTTAETVDFNSEPAGEPLAEIEVATQDGSFDRTLTFYALDNYTCLIAVDGRTAYTCRRSYLTALQNNMDIYDNYDEDFATTWS